MLVTAVIVVAVAGRVIPKVNPATPVTVKLAAVTVPTGVGRVHPPVTERVPAGVIITVPAVAFTEMLPKFMSTVLAIAIGVIIVAVAEAVAVAPPGCAKAPVEKANITNAKAKIFEICFIFV
jgi:hypothetical protein